MRKQGGRTGRAWRGGKGSTDGRGVRKGSKEGRLDEDSDGTVAGDGWLPEALQRGGRRKGRTGRDGREGGREATRGGSEEGRCQYENTA